MTAKDVLMEIVGEALPAYNVYKSNGLDMETFKKSNTTKSPAALVTFDGFDNLIHYENAKVSEQLNRYTISLINEKGDIETDVRTLCTYINNNVDVEINGIDTRLIVKGGITYDAYKDEAAEIYVEITTEFI